MAPRGDLQSRAPTGGPAGSSQPTGFFFPAKNSNKTLAVFPPAQHSLLKQLCRLVYLSYDALVRLLPRLPDCWDRRQVPSDDGDVPVVDARRHVPGPLLWLLPLLYAVLSRPCPKSHRIVCHYFACPVEEGVPCAAPPADDAVLYRRAGRNDDASNL